MQSLFKPLFLALSVLAVASRAQESSAVAALAAFPDCAATCIVVAITSGLCSATNQTCICTDPVFQSNVTTCVTDACTIPESLVTKNATLASCGATPRHRGQELITVSAVMASLAGAFVILRFGYKLAIARIDLGLDDWIILATLVCIIPSAAITKAGTVPNGLGKDIWVLTASQITNVGKYFYIMAWMYFLQAALLKLSFVAFYMRIFPARNVQRLLWGTFIAISAWGLVFVIVSIFQCQPIHYFWTKWDGEHKGSCANANAISWSNAIISIALDLWILAIPLWQLRSLKMHWKKKVGVALMFSVGTFVTIVSILRLQSLVHFAATDNSTWEFYDVSLWSTIEICVGIICACLPTIRLLVVKFIPMLGGTSQRSNYYHYGTGGTDGNPRSKATKSGHRQNTVTVDSISQPRSQPGSEHGSDEPRGIFFQKSYTVQYNDSDEAGLVPMRDLDGSERKRGVN